MYNSVTSKAITGGETSQTKTKKIKPNPSTNAANETAANKAQSEVFLVKFSLSWFSLFIFSK